MTELGLCASALSSRIEATMLKGHKTQHCGHTGHHFQAEKMYRNTTACRKIELGISRNLQFF